MQALLCRQSGVLQRLEEMDRETESLRRELADSTTARDQLASRLAGLQAECSSLQTQVAEQEVIIYTFIDKLSNAIFVDVIVAAVQISNFS